MASHSNGHSAPVSAFSLYRTVNNKTNGKVKKKRAFLETTITKKLKLNNQSKKKIILERCKDSKPNICKVEKNNTGAQRKVRRSSHIEEDDHKNERINNIEEKLDINDNPALEALTLFNWLIAPLSPDSFFETYWEKVPVHIKRSHNNYYKHILDSAVLDKVLRNNPLHYTRNVDVVSYENGVKEIHNQEGRAHPSALWDYFGNGCSIRVLNPQSYNNKIHLLLATLQEYFGTMVGANVYLTPPGSQGFAPHYDDIEAFVVQVEGRKHWKLYQPRDAELLARFSSPNLNHTNLDDPFMELTLEAGELLYFPRGTIHEGCTDENTHSLHITISVYQQTSYTDLLQQILPNALKRASENDVEFRKGLPLNYLKSFGATTNSVGEDRITVINKIQDLLQSLVKYIDIDNAADQLGKKFMYDSMPPVPSMSETKRTAKANGAYLKNGNIANRVSIELDTRVRLIRYYCVRLVTEEGVQPKLYYNTENSRIYHGEEEQWLELLPNMIPLVQVLQNTYPNYVPVKKLPLKDVSMKMQLVSDLWENGLLITEKPLEPNNH